VANLYSSAEGGRSLFFIIPCLNCVIAKVKSHCNFVVSVKGCRPEVTTNRRDNDHEKTTEPLTIPAQKNTVITGVPVIIQNKPKIVQGKSMIVMQFYIPDVFTKTCIKENPIAFHPAQIIPGNDISGLLFF